MSEVKMVSFINTEYKKEWVEWVPGFEGSLRYCEGTYTIEPDGTKMVYDGATSFMGRVNPDGSFSSNRDCDGDVPTIYELTFLRAAKEN